MARAGQQVLRDDGRLEDRISVGVLARAFPREAVEEVIGAAGARELRNRMLPAWLTVYFVLALALFMDMGAGRVMRRLAGTLAWAAQGITVTIPSEEALSNARARLGAEPLRLLFEKTAGLLAPAGTPGAFGRGLHLVSLDGTTVDLQDTEANWGHFGGPSTRDASGARLRGAFPQARLLALAESGTRALVAAVTGAYATGEKTLTAGLLPRLGPEMLVLADRNFAGYDLWRGAAATGAQLLWRIGVRVIEYRLEDDAGQVTETFTLITTLLDPAPAPARELAELYRSRWEIETALGAVKSGRKGAGVVLRSKTPDGAAQEIWALLCAYHAIREMICAAAALAAPGPLRICFVSAMDTVRGPAGDPAGFSPCPDRPARPRLTGRHRLRHQPRTSRPQQPPPRQAQHRELGLVVGPCAGVGPFPLEVVEVDSPDGLHVGRDRDHAGRGAPLELVEEQAGEQEGREMVEGEGALEPVSGDVPGVPVPADVVDQNIDPGQALEYLVSQQSHLRPG